MPDPRHVPSRDRIKRRALLLFSLPFWLGPCTAAADTSIIPIPVVPVSKNQGASVGLIAPILKTDSAGEIQQMITPLVLYNEDLFGTKVAGTYFRFWPGTRVLKLTASYSTNIERRLRLDYMDRNFGDGRYVLDINIEMDKSASERFFGFTQQSRHADQSNYTLRETRARFSLGWKLPDHWILGVQEFLRDDAVQPGAFQDQFPFTKTTFPAVPGVDGATLLSHRLWALYDSRDAWFTPTEGSYLSLFAEGIQSFRGPDTVYTRYGLDARHLFPFRDKHVILATRLLLESVNGPNIPFFDRSSLGGENMLRGFGLDRFMDDTVLAANAEARIRLFHTRAFKAAVDWEVAPFLDVGRVMGSYRDALRNYEVNPGIGVRAVARPYTVGRVDIGFGREGKAVFAGLEFPF